MAETKLLHFVVRGRTQKQTARQRLSVDRFINNSTMEYALAGCHKTPAGESIGEGRDVGGEVAQCGAAGPGVVLRLRLNSRQGCRGAHTWVAACGATGGWVSW